MQSREYKKHKIAVLISGEGSNLCNLLKVCHYKLFPCEISVVFTSAGYYTKRTKRTLMKYYIKDRQVHTLDNTNRKTTEAIITDTCKAEDVRFICLCGWMPILSPEFVREWEGRILNIHPSLLPKHKGLNTHRKVLEAGDILHGCTVHYVDEGVDTGRMIMQSFINVDRGDTVKTLRTKVLELEHYIYPIALTKAIQEYEVVNYLETDIRDIFYFTNLLYKHKSFSIVIPRKYEDFTFK